MHCLLWPETIYNIALIPMRQESICCSFLKISPLFQKEKTVKTNKIDHICIAVKDLEAARKGWEPVLGKSEPDDSYVDELEKIRVARYWLGGIGFELMESTSPDGPVAKWIEKNGEGVMVISFNVNNTRETVKELESKGYPVIPTPGGEKTRSFRDSEFAFIHPKKMNNVLLEVIDYKWNELKER
jgi:methylmalonyl-CoA/ethylmalonyl-CoA epimerase